MADNTTLNAGTGGDVIASDEIGAAKYQRIKLIFGSDGVNTGDVSPANPFPVVLATVSSNPVIATTTSLFCNVASVQSIAGGTTALTLFSTTTTRCGASIWNDSISRLFVKYGQGASTTLYSFKVAPYGYWEMSPNGFAGVITGVWDVATGSAFTTDWSYS